METFDDELYIDPEVLAKAVSSIDPDTEIDIFAVDVEDDEEEEGFEEDEGDEGDEGDEDEEEDEDDDEEEEEEEEEKGEDEIKTPVRSLSGEIAERIASVGGFSEWKKRRGYSDGRPEMVGLGGEVLRVGKRELSELAAAERRSLLARDEMRSAIGNEDGFSRRSDWAYRNVTRPVVLGLLRSGQRVYIINEPTKESMHGRYATILTKSELSRDRLRIAERGVYVYVRLISGGKEQKILLASLKEITEGDL